MIRPGSLFEGQYRILRLLGEGGTAEVWLARDERRDRAVAIKLLADRYARDESIVRRFRREAALVAALDSPHIVRILRVSADSLPCYLVMEYVDGVDLRRYIRAHAPLSPQVALDLIGQIARGVAAVHAAGLVHRDLKPGNVLVSRSGSIRLADFGIAREIAAAALTEPGTVWGTSHYLSPEQAQGAEGSPASDVYSLGILLFEMLTGQLPFPGNDPVAVAIAHIKEPVPNIQALAPTLPRGLVRLLYSMLAKAPELRPPTGAALVERIEALAHEAGSRTIARPVVLADAETEPAPGDGESVRRGWRLWRGLRRNALVAAALAGAMLLVGAALMASNRPRPLVGNAGLSATATGTAVVDRAATRTALAAARVTPSATLPPPTATPTATPIGFTAMRPRTGNGPDAAARSLDRDSTITLDGNLSEWQGSAIPLRSLIRGPESWSGLGDLSGEARFAWDRVYLYLAISRADDEHLVGETQRGEDLFRGDAVELWLDVDLLGDLARPDADADDFQLAFTPGDFRSIRPEGVIYLPAPRAPERDRELKVRAEPLANGYTLEARIPWTLLGVTPNENLVLGYAVVLNDTDSQEAEEPESQVGSSVENPYRAPTRFGNLTLAP